MTWNADRGKSRQHGKVEAARTLTSDTATSLDGTKDQSVDDAEGKILDVPVGSPVGVPVARF